MNSANGLGGLALGSLALAGLLGLWRLSRKNEAGVGHPRYCVCVPRGLERGVAVIEYRGIRDGVAGGSFAAEGGLVSGGSGVLGPPALKRRHFGWELSAVH